MKKFYILREKKSQKIFNTIISAQDNVNKIWSMFANKLGATEIKVKDSRLIGFGADSENEFLIEKDDMFVPRDETLFKAMEEFPRMHNAEDMKKLFGVKDADSVFPFKQNNQYYLMVEGKHKKPYGSKSISEKMFIEAYNNI